MSTSTRRASSSSATSIAIVVVMPWPTSARGSSHDDPVVLGDLDRQVVDRRRGRQHEPVGQVEDVGKPGTGARGTGRRGVEPEPDGDRQRRRGDQVREEGAPLHAQLDNLVHPADLADIFHATAAPRNNSDLSDGTWPVSGESTRGDAGSSSVRGRMLILAILVFGIFVGWLAQLALGMGSKPDAQALIAGLAGSFVGGMLASLLAGDGVELKPSGLIGSFVGAVIVLLIWKVVTDRQAPKPNQRKKSPKSGR